MRDFSINPNAMRKLKKATAIIISLVLPPLGLLLAAWLALKARKSGSKYYATWAVMLLATALAGGLIYIWLYLEANNHKQSYVYPTEQSKANITVCLDGEKTIIITNESPYHFDVGDSKSSGSITPTLARLYLEKSNGNFEIGVGSNKGLHHIEEGECPG